MKILFKRIFMFLACLFFLICSIPPCVSNIRAYYGMRDAKYLDGRNMSPLREGEYVKIMYDCAFTGFMAGPVVRKDLSEQFFRLRLYGSDEYVVICLNSDAYNELQRSGAYFLRTEDAANFSSKYRYELSGQVRRMESSEREDLQTSMLNGMFKDPDAVEKTNMEYYIYHIEDASAKGKMLISFAVTAAWAMASLFFLLALWGRIIKMRYGKKQEVDSQKETE